MRERETTFINFSRLLDGDIVAAKDLLEEDPTNGEFLLKLVLNSIITMAYDSEKGLQVRLTEPDPHVNYVLFEQ